MTATVDEKPVIPPPPTGEGLTFEKVWAMFQETREQMKETDLKFQKTERIVKRVSKQMGDLHNRFGEMAEHLVAPGIAERFNDLGFHFDRIAPGGVKLLDKDKKTKTEIDLLLENGEYIIAAEVKTKPALKDIEYHLKRLEILREDRDKWHDVRKIRGAIAGAIFPSEVKKAVIEAGLYAIEQSGDTMRIDIPEGFVPAEW